MTAGPVPCVPPADAGALDSTTATAGHGTGATAVTVSRQLSTAHHGINTVLTPSSAPAAPRGMLGQLLSGAVPMPPQLTAPMPGMSCNNSRSGPHHHQQQRHQQQHPLGDDQGAGDGGGSQQPIGRQLQGAGGDAPSATATEASTSSSSAAVAPSSHTTSGAIILRPPPPYIVSSTSARDMTNQQSAPAGQLLLGGTSYHGPGGNPIAAAVGTAPFSCSPQLPFAFTPSSHSITSFVEQHHLAYAVSMAGAGGVGVSAGGGGVSGLQAPSPPVSGRDISALATIRRPSW